MCGICGFVTNQKEKPQKSQIQKMVSAMKHRGPDDEGYYTSEEVGLGMCRLAILDIQEGHQPMTGRTGKSHVVFNGEIYNYPDLRQQLEKKGYQFKTRCDTEVLGYLYEEDGEEFVKRLRGMFAIAIWDEAQKKLVLARDQIGIKPLYYRFFRDGKLVFGSEMKALFALFSPSEPDESSILDYFSLLYIPSPKTIYKEIYQVPAAHVLVWQQGKISLKEYWRPTYKKQKWSSFNEAAEALRDKISETVRLHLASDVPLGVFLSGGFDSASVTAMMAEHVSEPIKTFTLSFGKEALSYDEAKLARMVSDCYGNSCF